MHLAIVTPYPPSLTGIGQYGYYLSGALSRSGAFDRITVLTEASSSGGAIETEPGITVERIWRFDQLEAGERILRRLGQLKPDLVWYNLGASSFGRSPLANLSGLLSPALGRLKGLPSVVTLHVLVEQTDMHSLDAPGGPLARWGARLITFTATRADVVCVTLRHHARWLHKRWPNLRLFHIPIGSYDQPQLLACTGKPELLIFGLLAPFKGLELLLDAFQDLRRCFPDLRLTVAGGEHPRFPGYLRQVRQDYGEHPAVRWLGFVPEAHLQDLFRQASIVIIPSTATTGSSSVLYRATTWGRPVVSSDLPELRAVADEGGLRVEFFPSGDRAGLAQAVTRMLVDHQWRDEQVLHNLNAVAKMTLGESCQAYLRAFDLALAARDSSLRIAVPVRQSQELFFK